MCNFALRTQELHYAHWWKKDIGLFNSTFVLEVGWIKYTIHRGDILCERTKLFLNNFIKCAWKTASGWRTIPEYCSKNRGDHTK